MKTPAYLKKGDTIAIVSTARKVSRKELEPSFEFIKKWGLEVVLGKSIEVSENQFAGSDEWRAEDFQQMLDDPKIKAIWCARGGYGTVRIIDKLDFSSFKKSPKWIIGYSDVTVLHSHIHNLGVESLHAQMPLDIENKTKETADSIEKVLFGKEYSISYGVKTYKEACGNTLQEYTYSNSFQEEADGKVMQKFNRQGLATGEIIGGNLSILYSLCGSNSSLKTDGKILFFEDLDEYLYHIDRMMMNLKRNGMLENLAGLIVGGMTEMNDNAIPFGKTAKEIIFDIVKEYNYPICFDFPSGHIEDNRALILGREVTLEVTENETRLVFKNLHY